MTTTTLATIEDPTAQKERLAIGGFLAGYIATTRSVSGRCQRRDGRTEQAFIELEGYRLAA